MINEAIQIDNLQSPACFLPHVIGSLSFFNADNLEIMRGFKDKEFDLAIVDPPYGLGKVLQHTFGKENKLNKQKLKDWDNEIPPQKYFDELFRISKNQIIWGGNYFPLHPTRCFICWDKMVFIPSMSRIELAWTSFDKLPQLVQYNNNDSNRIHLTQKPVELYDYLLTKFAEPFFKILDTHLGSGSIAIAVEKANRLDKMNLQFVGIEIDKEYYEKALNRIEQYCRQGTLSF